MNKSLVGFEISPKAKVKTRPNHLHGEGCECGGESLANEDEHQDRLAASGSICVDKKSLQVFANMFAIFGAPKGQTKWEDFVKAMMEAGMSATHNGGSAVTFENSMQKIVIHRPHPDTSINPVRLRSIGKRLSKWFGWKEGTFVEREKGGA